MMQRVTVFVVVEGHSESGFLRPLLASHLGGLGIDLTFRSSAARAPRAG
jgi:hypothetical protein